MNATLYIDLSDERRNETLVGIAKARMICSFFSIGGCFTIMVIYLVLCIQIYHKKKTVNPQEEQTNPKLESQNKIGLGSHFMLFLILANFLSSFLPIIFYVYYKKYVSNVGDTLCTILGFCHNFLDLCAICWTLVVVQLFKTSTQITEFAPGQEGKYFLFATLFSILFPLMLTVLPFLLNLISNNKKHAYGDAGTHCSFFYHDAEWISIAFSFIVLLCIIYIIFLLVKVRKYYSKKLLLLAKGSEDYKVFRIYVFVFKIFPFILIISRILKGVTRALTDYTNQYFGVNVPAGVINALNYLSAISFCLNGFFNSLVCISFFRSVFHCGKDREKSINSSLININEIEGKLSVNPARNATIQNELGDSIEIDD